MDPLNGLNGRGVGAGLTTAAGEPVEPKTQFMTREGLYSLLNGPKYSRPHPRLDFGGPPPMGGREVIVGGTGAPVRLSLAPAGPAGGRPGSLNGSCSSSNGEASRTGTPNGAGPPPPAWAGPTLAFNLGKEILVYPFQGVRQPADLTKPIDKRTYKGTCPTCHDFGPMAANSDILPLLIGFSLGQIQLVDPIRKDLSKLYNEERLIEKSRVTCIKWIPGSPNSFLVSHASGHMYIYNQDLPFPPTAPVYQPFKAGEGYSISTCKTKSSRNPVYRWSVGMGAINEFAFSPCGHFLALVSQDGYLRVFDYDKMDLVGIARSYFGGLLCVGWSPDGKYIVLGGEDDLVTVYSVLEKRVVVRGQGHKSWVSQVSFDPFNVSYGDVPDGLDFSGSDEEGSLPSHNGGGGGSLNNHHIASPASMSPMGDQHVTCYRFGSVGEDTQICLWDITEDTLQKASLVPCKAISSCSSQDTRDGAQSNLGQTSGSSSSKDSGLASADTTSVASSGSVSTATSLTQRLAALNFSDKSKEHKRNFSLTGGAKSNSDKSNSQAGNGKGSGTPQAGNSALNGAVPEYVKLGSHQCPRLNEIPLIEPLVMKKIAHERLTALVFREDCLVTACQDGLVSTWSRPGRVSNSYSGMMCPGSPPATGLAPIPPSSLGSSRDASSGTIV